METVGDFYGPWIRLMLQIGLPLLVLSTPAMFLFERGSLLRQLTVKLALLGWTLALLSMTLYFVSLILQEMFANLTGI
jgi:hypothetical protein